jgi:DNA-binding NtrC family response regulator
MEPWQNIDNDSQMGYDSPMKLFVSFITIRKDIEATLSAQAPTGPNAEAVLLLKKAPAQIRPDHTCFLSMEEKKSAGGKKVLEYCHLVGIDPDQVLFLNAHKRLNYQLNNLKLFAEIVHTELEQWSQSLPGNKPRSFEWLLFLERASMLLSWAFFHFALTKRPHSKLLAIRKQGKERSLDALEGLEISPDLMSAREIQAVNNIGQQEVQIPQISIADAMDATVVKKDDSTLQTYKAAKFIATLRDNSKHIPSTLILGESGVGKEDLAHYIHNCANKYGTQSAQSHFVTMNCAGLSETLADSLLFGHRQGSFTGADADHGGLIEKAQGGTLFLDEVADLAPTVQAKLLRVLQERKYHRLGEEGKERHCNRVRFIFATCQNDAIVPGEKAKQAVRRDLFERIAQYQLTLKPLRERPADLAERIGQLLAQFKDFDKAEYTLPKDCVKLLANTGLDGNFRELERRFRKARIHYQCSASENKNTPPLLDLFLFEKENAQAGKKPQPASPKEYSLELTPQEVFQNNQPQIRTPFPLQDNLKAMAERFQSELYQLTQSKPEAARMLGYKSHNSIR